MTQMNGNPFRFWWDMGYRSIIPIVPPGVELSPTCQLAQKLSNGRDDRGKAPGVRRADGLWTGLYGWQVRETTETDIEQWYRMGAGVGLADDGGLLLLDIDAQDEATANAIEADAVRMLGPAPCRVGSWPKRLLLYRVDQTLPFMAVTFKGPGEKPDRVEALAKPKQGVVKGVHNKTGKEYEWVRDIVPREQLTLVAKREVEAFFALQREKLPAAELERGASLSDREAVDQETLKGGIDLVRRAVASLPNTAALYPSYDSMVVMGQAIHAACADDPDAGFDIWDEWAGRWEGDGYTPGLSESTWATFKAPHSVGAGWIFDQAKAHGDGSFAPGEQWFDHDVKNNLPGGAEGTNCFLEGPVTKPSRLRLETLTSVAETALTAAARPLVKGLLDQGAMTVLYGESNVGKTFVAMSLAYYIAAGIPWGGMRCTRMRVVYVAAEGGMGARKRAAALAAKYGPQDDFLYVLSPVNLLDPNADLAPLIELLLSVPDLGLVCLDTLSRIMAGGDENSSVDLGTLVRHLDAIRAATGAHVLTVHHSGKDTAKGARGHSLLRAATDTEIEVSEGRVAVTKQRDLDREFITGFDLVPVTLGVDADGDPVTSCTVTLRPVSAALAPIVSERDAALAAIRAGEWRLDVRAGDAWVGVPVGLALGLNLGDEADKARVRDVVTAWLREGVLQAVPRTDKHRKQRVYITVPDSIFD